MRGRGGHGRGGRGRRGPFRPPPARMVTKPVFDLHLCEGGFDRATPVPDDSAFTQLLLKRNGDMSPTDQEQTAVLNLVTKIAKFADNLIVAPASFAACQLDEVRPVGSYKKGTMLRGKNVADVVIVLKTLPTKEAIELLGNKFLEDMKGDGMIDLVLELIPRGFSLKTHEAKVNCLIATLHNNIRNLERDTHLESKIVYSHLNAIRHIRWFEENGQQPSVKILVRLLKDLKNRFTGLTALKPWMIDLLAHYSVVVTASGESLPINVAFRRSLQLLAAGFFLPLSSSLNDPCENVQVKIHNQLSLEEQDLICMTAQTLVRMLAHGGYKFVLGMEGDGSLTDVRVMNGVVISPLQPVYEKMAKQIEKEDEEMQAESVPMEDVAEDDAKPARI